MKYKRNFLSQLTAGLLVGLSWIAIQPAYAEKPFLIIQSTTSTQNSGFYDYLNPKFTAETGIDLRVIAVGTGQAIKNAQNCDGDVLVVHSKAAEEKFVAEGYGVKRTDLMYNDFVVVGPEGDPAKVGAVKSATEAFRRISDAGAVFVSRGDDSGTHKKELELWGKSKVDVKAVSGTWYRDVGQGMGAALNTAVGMGAYILADRASWNAFSNKKGFKIVLEGDKDLFNQYGVIVVSPNKCPNVKLKLAQRFEQWVLSAKGQQTIANYKKDGQSMFFPNAPN